MQKSRRAYIRALIFLSVSALMLTCYMTAWHLMKNKVQREEQYRFNRSLTSLSESVTQLKASMDKLAVAGDVESIRQAASQTSRAAGLSEDAILSFDGDRRALYGLLRCVSLCGSFGEYCADRYTELGELPSADALYFGLLREYTAEAERLLLLLEQESMAREASVSTLAELSLSEELFSLFDDLPELGFDHKASPRQHRGDSSFTKRALPLTRREAERKAQEILDSEITLTYGENTLSPVEVYSFYCDNAQIDISKNGGYPIRILRDITSSGAPLEQSVLLTRMGDYLASLGYSGLTPISGELIDHIFTAKFIYTEGSLLDYTSAVRISCLADTARVVFLDASSYAVNRGAFSQPILPSETPVYLLLDGSGSPHYCILIENRYYDITTGSLIHAPILP